jgi:hypothetical protein
MSFLSIALKETNRVPEFEPDQCTTAIATVVGDSLSVDPRDQLLLSFQRAQALFKDATPDHPVLRALDRDMRTQGPAHAFEMRLGGKEVHGVAKRSSFTLLWKGRLDESDLQSVIRAILSVSPPVEDLVIRSEQDD